LFFLYSLLTMLFSFSLSIFIFLIYFFFFFNDTATTEIYTLSLHDALPISASAGMPSIETSGDTGVLLTPATVSSSAAISEPSCRDRKSTRLNSSHSQISYAVFCLKKKKKKKKKTKKQQQKKKQRTQ